MTPDVSVLGAAARTDHPQHAVARNMASTQRGLSVTVRQPNFPVVIPERARIR